MEEFINFIITPVAHAQTFASITSSIIAVLTRFIPVLLLLSTVVFIWGVIIYITAGGNEEKIKEGRNFIIWGLVALAVILAVWGLVRIIVGTFFDSGQLEPPEFPDLPGANP